MYPAIFFINTNLISFDRVNQRGDWGEPFCTPRRRDQHLICDVYELDQLQLISLTYAQSETTTTQIIENEHKDHTSTL